MPDNKYPEDKKLYWETFENHVIEPDGEGAFVYHKPGTRIYLCYIYFRHGCIIIYGDVGPFVYNTNSPDSFQWAAGGLESESYVMGKLKGIYKVYDPKTTYEHLKESLTDDEDEENLKRLEEGKDSLDLEADATQFVREIGYDDECLCYTWDANSDAQWAYWILRTFMDKIKTRPAPADTAGESIRDIYNRFKHLDKLLSDPQWLDGQDSVHKVAHEMWMAIKKASS